jgi:hypothetical protein
MEKMFLARLVQFWFAIWDTDRDVEPEYLLHELYEADPYFPVAVEPFFISNRIGMELGVQSQFLS